MILQLKRKIAEKFDEEFRFFRGWIDGPRTVGTPLPTSMHTGRAMAGYINAGSGLPILEIGPGTGTITRAILKRGIAPENLYAVEYSSDFVTGLKREFPKANILLGDAFKLDEALGDKRGLVFDCVISAIPLLNIPMKQRIGYIDDMLRRIPAGRPVVQVTYGPMSPIPAGLGRFLVERADFVMRNVPPAHLWTFRALAA